MTVWSVLQLGHFTPPVTRNPTPRSENNNDKYEKCYKESFWRERLISANDPPGVCGCFDGQPSNLSSTTTSLCVFVT